MFQSRSISTILLLVALTLVSVISAKTGSGLQIGVKYKPDECPLKTRKGDRLSMQ
jgi:FK506-binding protein 2